MRERYGENISWAPRHAQKSARIGEGVFELIKHGVGPRNETTFKNSKGPEDHGKRQPAGLSMRVQ